VRNILPPSPFRSVWTFLVYCLTLSTPVWKLLSFLGVVDLIATYADDIGTVLAHPLGMWIPVAVGFALLMFINYRERRTVSSSSEASASTPMLESTASKEVERLTKEVEQRDKNIRALRQGYEELAAKLSDPTANRQREERMVRERCTEVATELTVFWQSHQRTGPQEFVAVFQKRQEWKVSELRERLDEQGLLTTQERDILTFRSGDDLNKIEQIIFLLRKIGDGG
jgi:hypothetical protein